MLKWLWISVAVIVLDQVTKALASSYLQLHDPMAVMPLFNLTLMHNTGAAFSFLSDAGGWQRWFFTLVAIVVSVAIIVWLRRLKPEETVLAAGLSLILGGALGNVWDRLQYGYVVDFIQVYYDRWYFPAFNIADSAITIGAILLLWDTWRQYRREAASKNS